jgi:hypothetical protein
VLLTVCLVVAGLHLLSAASEPRLAAACAAKGGHLAHNLTCNVPAPQGLDGLVRRG